MPLCSENHTRRTHYPEMYVITHIFFEACNISLAHAIQEVLKPILDKSRENERQRRCLLEKDSSLIYSCTVLVYMKPKANADIE